MDRLWVLIRFRAYMVILPVRQIARAFQNACSPVATFMRRMPNVNSNFQRDRYGSQGNGQWIPQILRFNQRRRAVGINTLYC